MARNMIARNIDIGKEKLYISTNQDARRACRFTPLSSRQKFLHYSNIVIGVTKLKYNVPEGLLSTVTKGGVGGCFSKVTTISTKC